MTNYEIYVLLLCVIVFVMLTGLSAVMLTTIYKMSLRLIRCGEEDENIKTEYWKKPKKKNSILDCVVLAVLSAALILSFAFSMYARISEYSYHESIPTVTVVKSGSMATKHKDNDYLVKNNLNDQVQTFDLILLYKAPGPFDIKLYDIVAYEVDGILVLHRVVGIEEPNAQHPDERYYLIQGDAVGRPDRFPVKYDQIKAIYRGQRVPFVGSFVAFMQSPAGWLCILVVVAGIIVTPIFEKNIEKEKKKRLIAMGLLYEETEPEDAAV